MADFRHFRNIPETLLKMIQMQYQRAWDSYTTLLLDDPAISTRLEALLRVSSYIVPGRFVASKELGELLYGLSNLVALLHDHIFRENLKLPKYPGGNSEQRLLMYLSVIECVEVFLEMSADSLWDEIGKWLMVVVIQVIKVVIRMMMLYKDKPKLQKYPLVPLLNREIVFQAVRNQAMRKGQKSEEEPEPSDGPSGSHHVWQGKRSGRVIRSLSASPPNGFRSWKVPESARNEFNPSELSKQQFYAELLYILRPMLHLPSMFIFGETSWKPWLFACIADITSLTLHTKCKPKLAAMEKTEISRRMVLMFFYLLRSPFYDRLTKLKIISVLGGLSRNIPFLSLVINPLLDYLPSWQRTYFYNWSC